MEGVTAGCRVEVVIPFGHGVVGGFLDGAVEVPRLEGGGMGGGYGTDAAAVVAVRIGPLAAGRQSGYSAEGRWKTQGAEAGGMQGGVAPPSTERYAARQLPAPLLDVLSNRVGVEGTAGRR